MLASLFYTLASCYTNFFKSTRLSSLIRVRVRGGGGLEG